MPVAPPVTYPGVYIQEVESPVHTIAPVATSVTAFIGRALRGPTDADGPVLIHSFADFVRIFGGLWNESELGYAVNDFFLNGGSDAVILRLWKTSGVDHAQVALTTTGNPLTLTARYPGAWGNKLKVRVETIGDANVRQAVASDLSRFGSTVAATDVFTLIVHDDSTGATETFPNVTLVNSPNRLDRVLAEQSQLVTYAGQDITTEALPGAHPAATADSNTHLPRTVWEDPAAHQGANGTAADDGAALDSGVFSNPGASGKMGLYALDKADIFNLLVIPPFSSDTTLYTDVLPQAIDYCKRRRAIVLVDPPPGWTSKDAAKTPITGLSPSENAAVYFPRIRKADPLRKGQVRDFAPAGAIAGVIARTDLQRGVWKAPAGLEATVSGVTGLAVRLTDPENGELNPLGVNCLRTMPAAGVVVWGTRTMVGDDRLASQWKYLPVRRTALFIEESLYRGTQWAVFEPNDEPLWAQLRLNLGVFMHDLFRQGAFQGSSPKEAYFVKCDSTTTTQSDIDRGIVNVIVGFAPLKPAEFVVLYIQQIAGQLAT
jgi:phage tail sheath protein FI